MRACLSPRGGSVRGLRLWSSLILTLALDGAGRWGLVLFLFTVHAGDVPGSPPPGVEAIAWIGQLQWLLVLWAYRVDRRRRAVTPN